MRNPIVLAIAKIIQTIEIQMIQMHLLRPKIVVYVDGGLCAQMIAYLRGQYYAESGISVYYDMTFYDNGGKDMDGRFERPFELLTLFPRLHFQAASKWRTFFWRKIFKEQYEQNLLPVRETLKGSRYLYGFPNFCSNEWLHAAFQKYFAIENAIKISTKLVTEGKLIDCAVHIRRGDLAGHHELVGYKVVPITYFFNAIKYVQKKYGNVKLHFFSDELEWVEKNICPYIEISYELVSGHKGYEDLLLIATCPVIIASQGSFGRIASMLNETSELVCPEQDNCGFSPVERQRGITYIPIS